VPWPPDGGGGLAERFETDSPEIMLAEMRFRVLATAGARQLWSARMFDAERLLVQARREHAGGLPEDAMASLAKADAILRSVELDHGHRQIRQKSGGA
jgi:hypothetical protein